MNYASYFHSRYILYTFGLLLFTSCGSGDPAKTEEMKSYYPDTLITANESIFKFNMLIDRADVDPSPAEAALNEATGDYEIDCGEEFSLRFTQMSMTVEDFKSQINGDSPFPVAVTDEGPNHLIWQALLPDGTMSYYHLFAMRTINGYPMVIRSTEKADWSLQSVQKMLNSIEAIQ